MWSYFSYCVELRRRFVWSLLAFVRSRLQQKRRPVHEQDLSRLDPVLRQDLLDHRTDYDAFSPETVASAVSRVARRLGRRCQLERRLKIRHVHFAKIKPADPAIQGEILQ